MIIAKFYKDIRASKPYNQTFIHSRVEIEEDLNVFGTANFVSPIIEGVEKDQKIELYEVNEIGRDSRVFSGYIHDIKPIWKQFGEIQLELRGRKAMTDYRLFLSDYGMVEVDTIANRPLTGFPTNLGKRYFKGSQVFTQTGNYYTEGDPVSYISYSRIDLKTVSFVYVKDENKMYKFDGTSVSFLNNGYGIGMDTLLEEMTSAYNAQFGEKRTRETNIISGILVNCKKGDTRYGVLEDIAKNGGFVWDATDGKIRVLSDCFTDRSTGSKYTEIVFNAKQTSNANIKTIELTATRKRINTLFVRSGDVLYGPYTRPGFYGASVLEIRDGSINDKANKILDDLNQHIKTYKVEIEPNSIVADVGDKIKLCVENTNGYFNIKEKLLISKKISIYDKGKTTNYELQTVNTMTMTVENFNRKLSNQVRYNFINV